jgi:hypothetical protein
LDTDRQNVYSASTGASSLASAIRRLLEAKAEGGREQAACYEERADPLEAD